MEQQDSESFFTAWNQATLVPYINFRCGHPSGRDRARECFDSREIFSPVFSVSVTGHFHGASQPICFSSENPYKYLTFVDRCWSFLAPQAQINAQHQYTQLLKTA